MVLLALLVALLTTPRVLVPLLLFAGAYLLAVYETVWLVCLGGAALAALGAFAHHLERQARAEPRRPRQAPFPDVQDGIPLGTMVKTGDAYAPRLAGWHWLIGGGTGSGKSNTINCLLYHLAWMGDVQILGIDPKGGLELGPWEPRLAALAEEKDEWLALLRALHAEVKARHRYLRRRLKRVVDPSMGLDWLVLVIDEATQVLKLQKDPAVAQLLETLITLGRACGLSIVMATQRPAVDAIGSEIRDIADLRIAHRTSRWQMTETILGQKSVSEQGATAHNIPEDKPGLADVFDRATKRFAWCQIDEIPDRVVELTVRNTAHLAHRWDLAPHMPGPRGPRPGGRRPRPRRRPRADRPAPRIALVDEEVA